MDASGKTKIKGKIRIVTPVHIGGAQEKHWVEGIDFLTKYSTVFLLDEKKIVGKYGIEKYSAALVNRSLYDLLGDNMKDFSKQIITSIMGGIGTDIKTCIRNSLSGKPIIPGTSLKGALRSVIYNNIVGNSPIKFKDQIFGKIHEDIFRFMIVNDCEFNNSDYINTKTFNLRNTTKGGWKHSRSGNTTDNFNSKEFTIPHEIISVDDFSEFEIIFNSSTLATVKNEQNKINIFNNEQEDQRRKKPNILKSNDKSLEIFNGTQDTFFKIIYNYTKKYLKSEKAFFEKYRTDKSDIIIEQIDKLIALNNENAPLLRLGLGSGFHAMTGDTHFMYAHENTGIWGNPSEKLNDGFTKNLDYDINYKKFGVSFNESKRREGTVRFKSRKLAFSGTDDNLVFYPMGFVQLCSEEYFNENFKLLIEKIENKKKEEAKLKLDNEKRQKEELENQKKIKEEQLRIEAEKRAKEELAKQEALKPKYTDIKDLKKKKWVDAYVTGQNGRMLLFKPLVYNFEGQEFSIGYAAGMPLNTLIQVLCSSQGGKKLQFEGSPQIKK